MHILYFLRLICNPKLYEGTINIFSGAIYDAISIKKHMPATSISICDIKFKINYLDRSLLLVLIASTVNPQLIVLVPS